MRDIEFCGKRKDNDEWVIGDLIREIIKITYKKPGEPENSETKVLFNDEAVSLSNAGGIVDTVIEYKVSIRPFVKLFEHGEKPSVREYEVYPDTVGEYIGLLDCAGKKIYENDIFAQSIFNGEDYDAKYVVVRVGESFCLKTLKGIDEKLIGTLSSFGHYENGKLRKGRVIDNIFGHGQRITLKDEANA